MAKIGTYGVESESLSEWYQHYVNVFQAALGENVSTDPSTAIGRIVREMASVAQKVDELVIWVAAGLNIYQASGRQLTDYASLMGIPFREGTTSSVALTITGSQGTLIPAESRVRTSGGVIFETAEAALIPSAGTVTVTARSQRIGAVQAPAGSLTEILDVVAGWTSVTNASAATPGTVAESETEWVTRYLNRVAIHGQGTLENISARVAEISGIKEVVTLHNPTGASVTANGFTQAARSFSVVLSGSAESADIAQAIADTAPPGIPMTGSSTHTLGGITYKWTPATEVAIAVTLVTVIDLGVFPSNGRQEITRKLLAFIKGLSIGKVLDTTRFQSVVTEVVGHRVTTFTVTRSAGGALPDVTAITNWTLAEAAISITLSTS